MIEKTLERIAKALESIAESQLKMVNPVAVIDKPALKPAATTQPPPKEDKPATQPPPKTTQPPAATVQPPPAAEMTIPQVNEALMAEFTRLNNDRSLIDKVMSEEPFCVKTINELHPSKFAALIAAVKEIQA